MPLVGRHFLTQGQIQTLRPRVTFTLCSIWEVARRDGVTFRFASHDKPIVFERNVYKPIGPDASDMEQVEAGGETDFQVAGFLSADGIRPVDILTGKFDGATIRHYVIDWQRPWRWVRKHQWWMRNVRHNGALFEASIVGIERLLQFPAGRRYERECDKTLGSTECGAVPITTFGATVETVATGVAPILLSESPRLAMTFTAASWTPPRDGLMDMGKVVWTSGPNKGTTQIIASQTGRDILLETQTPFKVQAGDQATLFSGCDGTALTCKDDYSNKENFGGIEFMPSSDDIFQLPDS